MRTFDRRVADASTTNDTLAERLSRLEALLADRELQIRDLELARALLTDEANKLIHAATAREGIYQNTQQNIREKNDLVELLEEQIAAAHGAHEMQIDGLQAQLQREQLERSMAEGALETARKDVSRLQQEVGTLRSRILTDGGERSAHRARSHQKSRLDRVWLAQSRRRQPGGGFFIFRFRRALRLSREIFGCQQFGR